jgi:enamine deaminase RidA (YjgF/YER057c/UK114 family)
MTPEEILKSLGIELPEAPKPLGSYVPFVRTGNLIYLSGMLPMQEGKLTKTGRVGETVSLEEAAAAAKIAAINGLAVLKSAIGSLAKARRCVRIEGYVASAENFTDQPKVLNGASDFLFAVFGETGRHTRTAVGVNILPLNAPVEVSFIFELEE